MTVQHVYVNLLGDPVPMEQGVRYKVYNTEVYCADEGNDVHERREVFVHTVERKVPIEMLSNGHG